MSDIEVRPLEKDQSVHRHDGDVDEGRTTHG